MMKNTQIILLTILIVGIVDCSNDTDSLNTTDEANETYISNTTNTEDDAMY